MAGNRHIAWIDDARTITMLLVIVGHCTYTKIVTNYGGIDYFADITYDEYSIAAKLLNALVGLIYMFHMPLFMMLSGACFGLTIGKVSDRSSLVKNKSYASTFPHCHLRSIEYLWRETKNKAKDERRTDNQLCIRAEELPAEWQRSLDETVLRGGGI